MATPAARASPPRHRGQKGVGGLAASTGSIMVSTGCRLPLVAKNVNRPTGPGIDGVGGFVHSGDSRRPVRNIFHRCWLARISVPARDCRTSLAVILGAVNRRTRRAACSSQRQAMGRVSRPVRAAFGQRGVPARLAGRRGTAGIAQMFRVVSEAVVGTKAIATAVPQRASVRQVACADLVDDRPRPGDIYHRRAPLADGRRRRGLRALFTPHRHFPGRVSPGGARRGLQDYRPSKVSDLCR